MNWSWLTKVSETSQVHIICVYKDYYLSINFLEMATRLAWLPRIAFRILSIDRSCCSLHYFFSDQKIIQHICLQFKVNDHRLSSNQRWNQCVAFGNVEQIKGFCLQGSKVLSRLIDVLPIVLDFQSENSECFWASNLLHYLSFAFSVGRNILNTTTGQDRTCLGSLCSRLPLPFIWVLYA